MPADTRSSRKVTHDDVATQKEKRDTREGSDNAYASSPSSSTRKSKRLKSGNSQAPSPLQRSDKRKTSLNGVGVEASQVGPRGKLESNTSSKKRKKILPSYRYRDLFKLRKEAKSSDSARGRRLGLCTSSNSGGSTKVVSVAEDDDLHKEEDICGEDCAESTSKAGHGNLDFDLKELTSKTSKRSNSVESHSGHKPLYTSAEASMVGSDSQTHALMDISSNADVSIEEKDLQLDDPMDFQKNKCIICNLTGKLLYCEGKGCGRTCHSACLNSRWMDIYPGTWHCPSCTKNKIQCGVHSVSKGIESIWDVRVGNGTNSEAAKRQKEYFVKYKGLAHIHNCWLPEQQLLQEAPELVAEFVQRETDTTWRQEWSTPHRLLQKRSLMLPRSDGCGAQEVGSVNCQHEWLVKWRGLDYNEITWELEITVFFEKALDLMNDYERRREKARQSSPLQEVDEKQEKRKDIPIILSTLPLGYDTSSMFFINKLSDFWSRGQNILINDEQVQVSQIIYFILSLQSNVSRPFLVITPSSLISKWENEFSLVAPSINIIVYNGNRHAREMIRTLEFYEDGPRVMYEVLVSTVDIIMEDLEFIKSIRWEAIIMDERHKSGLVAESLLVKELAAGSMILLWMDQINENTIEYCNILSLLKCSSNVEGHQVASNSSISLLREQLSPFIVSGPKSVSSRLVEYWVPVQMSNVQLEQYCSSLLTNLTALCSKNDRVGLLREILISARQCCDHPYVVDPTLQGHLIKHLTPTLQDSSVGDLTSPEIFLDIGVKASGKLYLLDAILTKMKDQGQKVIILFKALGSSGLDLLGNILEDFVRLRFGEDSYERVDGGGMPSRRQASVSKFNLEKGRFIFLLETRACSPSIKVSSVDAVVIFCSDCNPLNDLKALQKIKMDSKLELKVFRLYTMCTIEEKVLLLSKRSILFESNLQGINFSTSHMLLTWGVSYLIRKLDEFHGCEGSPAILPQNSIMEDVLREFMYLLQKHETGTSKKFISSAWQNGANYSTDVSLLGEQYSHLEDEEPGRVFWGKLLEGRQPRWRFLSISSRRNRKRVQYYDGEVHPDEALKKQKKMGNTNGESCSPRVCKDVEKEHGLFSASPKTQPQLSPESGCETASAPKSQTSISSELRDQQKSLHQILKPDMKKLFQILGLKEDVQKMADRFLVFLLTNQRVIREPDTALQAFQISVCWIAAYILSEKLDHVESLSLAREHLNFNCGNDEAEYAFSKMQFSMTMFMRSEGINRQASLQNIVIETGGLASEAMNDNVCESTVPMQLKEKVAEGLLVQEGLDDRVLAPPQTMEHAQEIQKFANKVKKKREEKLASHNENKRCEVEVLKNSFQEKRAKREKKYKHQIDIICKINRSEADKSEKLKNLEAKRRQKLDQLDSDMATALKGIEAIYEAKENEMVKEADCKLQRHVSWIKSGLSGSRRSKEAFEEFGAGVVPLNSSSLSANDQKEGNANVPDAVVSVVRERGITDKDATSKFPPAATQINFEATTSASIAEGTVADSLGVQGLLVLSAVTTDEVEQIATSMNDQLSAENPALQTEMDASEGGLTASERYRPSRMEQLDEASSSTPNESTDSPSTIKTSVAQPFTNQHQVDSPPAAQEHATLGDRLNQLNNQHMCGEAFEMQNTTVQDLVASSNISVGALHIASDQAVRLDTTASHPIDLTEQRLASCVPENQLFVSSLPCQTVEARGQRALDRSIELTPRPSVDVSFSPSLHYLTNLPSRSLPATVPASYLSSDLSKEFDPLQREYERIRGESSQVSKTHEDMVSRIKLDRGKEIEEIVAQIRRKYDSLLQEQEASYSQKKNELEHNQRKVVMNIALAEAFRSKCMSIDHRVAQQVIVPSIVTQQLLQSQFARSLGSAATVCPQTASTPQTPGTMLDRSSILSSGNRVVGNGVRLPPSNLASMSLPRNDTTLRSHHQPPVHSTGSHGGPHLTEASARPMSLPQTPGSATDQSAVRSTAAETGALLPLPEINRQSETLNLSVFKSSLAARQPDTQTGGAETGLVCLSDDE